MSDLDRATVSVLAVGGTIAMTDEIGCGVQPTLDAETLLKAVPEIGTATRIRAQTLATVPGPHMDLSVVAHIAQSVERELAAGATGVVITQGTDTIEESSFALELMLATDAPVIVTGAMRSPRALGADGPANLLQAVQTAATPSSRGLGVAVLMDGAIYAPRHVHKIHTFAVSAFCSRAALIGEIIENRVTRFATPAPMPCMGISVGSPPSVALITAALGDDGRLLKTLPEIDYAAAVIAGMGGGHVNRAMGKQIEHLSEHMPVVMASRTGGGSTLKCTYGYEGGEVDLAHRGVIQAGSLSPLKARIAVALFLASGGERRELHHFLRHFEGISSTLV